MKSMNLVRLLFVLIVSNACNAADGEQDYSPLLETIGLYFYSPFYHEEQMIQKNIKLDGFLDELPVKVLIHGYIASRYHASIAPIKNAYLSAGNVNLIIVDWSQASYQMYGVSRTLTSQVAHRVSEILERFIKENEIDRGLIHLIGHSLVLVNNSRDGSTLTTNDGEKYPDMVFYWQSDLLNSLSTFLTFCLLAYLGAHIAGNTGRYMGGSLGRITGLDPAAPLYIKWSYDAIQITDATFIDIIHTNGEGLGEIWARGHIDFYPNYGVRSQPGCGVQDSVTLYTCSHFRATEYFAESILSPNAFIGVQCPITEILSRQVCSSTSADKVVMGEYTPREARGTYFLRTNSESPYGKGNYSSLYL